MPRRTIFDNAGDRFFITEDGDLVLHRSYAGDSSLVEASELEEFATWLVDEVNRLKRETKVP